MDNIAKVVRLHGNWPGKLLQEQVGPALWPVHLKKFYELLNGGAALATAAVMVGCRVRWENDTPHLTGQGWDIDINLILNPEN